MDPAGDTAALAEKLGLTYRLISDPELAAIRAWGVEDEENGIAWPAIFVVGKDGKIAWRSLSETYKVRPEPSEILEALGPGPAAKPLESPEGGDPAPEEAP